MKRFSVGALSVILALSMCGCGDGEETANESTPVVQENVVVEEMSDAPQEETITEQKAVNDSLFEKYVHVASIDEHRIYINSDVTHRDYNEGTMRTYYKCRDNSCVLFQGFDAEPSNGTLKEVMDIMGNEGLDIGMKEVFGARRFTDGGKVTIFSEETVTVGSIESNRFEGTTADDDGTVVNVYGYAFVMNGRAYVLCLLGTEGKVEASDWEYDKTEVTEMLMTVRTEW